MSFSPAQAPGPIAETAAATVSLLAPVARFSLRVGKADRAALARALGLKLPEKIGKRATEGAAEALCLGPDEWVVTAPEDAAEGLARASAGAAEAHSLAEIGDREISLRLEGPKAAELLTIGCPRDPASVPVGEGRRTVCDGVAVVLWRDGEQDFRLDVWRSFAPHLAALLVTGCAELAAEMATETAAGA